MAKSTKKDKDNDGSESEAGEVPPSEKEKALVINLDDEGDDDEEEKKDKVEKKEAEDEEDVDDAMPVPQVSIGPDGQIILNEARWVMDEMDSVRPVKINVLCLVKKKSKWEREGDGFF